MFDLIITNGLIITGTEQRLAHLAVRDGKIAALLAPEERADAHTLVDAKGLWVLPGVIDSHMHIRDPGETKREDFTTGTAAAAAGGVTTILEMPISVPPVSTENVFKQRIATVQPRSLIDFSLYGGAGSQNVAEIAALAEAGAVAYKTFLQSPHPGREHEFTGLWCADDGTLRELMIEVAKTGLRHCFHCESETVIQHESTRLQQAGRTDGLAHAQARPEIAEDIAVATVLSLAEEIGAKVQIVHMSSPRAVAYVEEARQRGVDVTAETCPHFLYVTDAALDEFGPYAKCNPPLRSAETTARLHELMHTGMIDMIGSDHAPYVPEEKAVGEDNIWAAPAGFPGIELMLPLFLTDAISGNLNMSHVVRLLSENAARIFGLESKGGIALGKDADIVLVDPTVEWTFDPQQSHTKARDIMHVYAGRRLKGQVVQTIVRGTTVFKNGNIVVEPGHGQFVRPAR